MKYDIKKLTLEEKLTLLTGRCYWENETLNGKLSEFNMHDGPNGVRMTDSDENRDTTAMPTLSALANTWNRELAYLQGKIIADDCIDNGIDIILGPGVNIKRTPLCGRNFEYFSEDPYLAGVLSAEYIKGVQDKGVGASLKHYCANNREFDRCYQTSEVDERTLHEIYLKPFEIAVKESEPWTVMCSYNPINGVYASENKKLLKDTLREKFGFNGLIVSDWEAVHNRYKALKATTDIAMPHNDKFYGQLLDAYKKGLITDEEIDFSVDNILTLIDKVNNGKKKVEFTRSERHESAVDIARESIVLLKNNDNILPISEGNVLVLGKLANEPKIGGLGSAFVRSQYKQKPLAQLLKDVNVKIKAHGAGQIFCTDSSGLVEGAEKFYLDEYRVVGEKVAFKEAYTADKVIVTVSTENSSEMYDNNTIKLSPIYEKFIDNLSRYTKNIILVIYGGSAVDTSSFEDKVSAIVYCGYSGEGVNEALAEILTGKTCPSGKLSETFPTSIEDTYLSTCSGNGISEFYGEGVFVGYRYYDTFNKQVAYPFGFGLSYAGFEYSDLTVKKESETDYVISYTVKNNSDFDAKEVSEVYVKDIISMVSRPEKELKAFSKDLIKAHGKKTVTVKLDKTAFAYYSSAIGDWQVENGDFEILIGSSSRDIKLKAKIEINLPEETQYSSEWD